MKISIRQANSSDVEEIAGLLGELGYPSTETEIEARLKLVESSSSDAVIVATVGDVLAVLGPPRDRVVAFLSLHVIPYFTTGNLVGRVSAFAVEEAERYQGIGRQMMAAAEDQARKMGCKAIEVTSADHREDAHAFYARLGYPKTSVKFFKKLI